MYVTFFLSKPVVYNSCTVLFQSGSHTFEHRLERVTFLMQKKVLSTSVSSGGIVTKLLRTKHTHAPTRTQAIKQNEIRSFNVKILLMTYIGTLAGRRYTNVQNRTVRLRYD